jgi:hypothetical protein
VDWPTIPNDHQVIWTPWDTLGIEHLHFYFEVEGNTIADGLVFGLSDGVPFRVHYSIVCDPGWNVLHVVVDQLERGKADTVIKPLGKGKWGDGSGREIERLAGCTDVDLSVSPFTNTIPIRRLNLGVGESAEIDVAYFKLPGFQVIPVRQRYTVLEATPTGRRYRYESIDSGYTAVLPVDEFGLVIDYPEAWRRVELPGTS